MTDLRKYCSILFLKSQGFRPKQKTTPKIGVIFYFIAFERVSGIEPPSHPWQGCIITVIRHPLEFFKITGGQNGNRTRDNGFARLPGEHGGVGGNCTRV